jgi:hypothetical protein
VAEQGGQTVSIDEMTGIQALERAAKSLPMKPGHVERREFEYIRCCATIKVRIPDNQDEKVVGGLVPQGGRSPTGGVSPPTTGDEALSRASIVM